MIHASPDLLSSRINNLLKLSEHYRISRLFWPILSTIGYSHNRPNPNCYCCCHFYHHNTTTITTVTTTKTVKYYQFTHTAVGPWDWYSIPASCTHQSRSSPSTDCRPAYYGK